MTLLTSEAASQRMRLILSLLLFQQVQNKPQPFFEAGCPHIELTEPKAKDLINWNLTQSGDLKVLSVNEVNSPSLKSAHASSDEGSALCTVVGYGVGKRDPAIVRKLLTDHNLSSKLRKNVSTIEAATALYMESTDLIPSAFIFSSPHMGTLCIHESVVLMVSCGHVLKHCYIASIQVEESKAGNNHKTLFRRRAPNIQLGASLDSHHTDQTSHDSVGGVRTVVVGVLMCVIGLLVLLVVLAMCGKDSDSYDPRSERAGSGEVAERPLLQGEVIPNIGIPNDQDPKINGTNSAVAITFSSVDKETSNTHESDNHQNSSSLKESLEKSQNRSYDPLPEVPKLELPQDKEEKKEGKGDDDDNPYTEVPKQNNGRMPDDSESDEEKNKKASGGASPTKKQKGSLHLPPYGKVSRHVKSESDDGDNDSYAEVRDVVRRGPINLNRERSSTDPIDPAKTGPLRDRRLHTESATNMPLPQIPASRGVPPVFVDDNEMYDSIPESELKKDSPSLHQSQKMKKKERLYESVYEMEDDKDLYESVPDDLVQLDSPSTPKTLSSPKKLSSPKTLSSPTISPTKAPDSTPKPPVSPIPKKAEQKKPVEKTLSAQNEEVKRRFSLFGRKKAVSVSNTKTKKGEQPESPPAIPQPASSTQNKPHSLPSIPPPPCPDKNDDEEDEEDTYDRVTPVLPAVEFNDAFHQGLNEDVLSKTKSLPMSHRTGGTAGGHPNIPLPRVPEDSRLVIVTHKRVMEGNGGPDDYDTVHISPKHVPDDDEPNYDTVRTEDMFTEPLVAEIDPPYDKIDNKELEELREKEKQLKDEMFSEPKGSDSVGKYSKLRHFTPEREGESAGPPPDHDEEGYAVVPKEIRMRKRALSASQGVRQQGRELSPDSVAAGYHLIQHEECEELSPTKKVESIEDQYASIDYTTKKDQKLEENLKAQEELRLNEEKCRSVSPIPPPLPPPLDPEDVEDFKEPPIPAHSEGMHQLDDEGLKLPQSATDPPYARVKSKVNNPYAEVGRPYAEVDLSKPTSHAQNSATASDNAIDEAMGYNVIGTVGVKTKTLHKKVDNYDEVLGYDVVGVKTTLDTTAMDEALGYDVVGTVGVQNKENETHIREDRKENTDHLKDELPTLETADSVNIYDSLLPE